MTRYKDELFHYSTKPSAAKLLRKKRVSEEEDTPADDGRAPKKKLSRRQMLLQALQKNPTKIGTDADNEADESKQDLSAKTERKKLASKSVKGKPRFPPKKASR